MKVNILCLGHHINLQGFGLWKYIRSSWDRFASYTCIEVGIGSIFLFWKDHWISNGRLKETYLKLFRFSRDSDAPVSDYMEWVNGQLQWKPLFLREVKRWESKSLKCFFDDLYALRVTHSGK